MVMNPVAARADGGAYMEFDRTHYLPGDVATAEAYVYLLKPQQGRLDRGPFYAYLVTTNRSFPQIGKPIPAGAIRLGTFQVEESRPKWFDLTVSFTVPDVAGDGYTVAMCNDPCTVQGFKEPIVGYISIVQTAREGVLLTQEPATLQPDLRAAPRREEAREGDGRVARAVRRPRPGALVDGEPDERDGGSARRRDSGGEHTREPVEAAAGALDRDRPGVGAVRARRVDPRPEAARCVSTRPSGTPPGGGQPTAATRSTGSDGRVGEDRDRMR